MIAQAEQPYQILKFPSLLEREGTIESGSPVSLQRYYQQILLPDLGEQSVRSLAEDRHALNRWTEIIGEIDLRDVTTETIKQFRDGLISGGRSAATVNKIWRELRAIFSAARDDGLIELVPQVGRRSASRLVKQAVKRQREIVTEGELAKLWRECRRATYPANTQHPAPKLWRVAVVLYWTYGPRTLDVLALKQSDLLWSQKLIQFESTKTGKLQGLPMTPIVEQHLRSIVGHAERLFPGFNSTGAHLKKTGRWKRGYYTTWRHEIGAHAQLDSPILIKNFRQRVVTCYNEIHAGLGSWIAGHFVPGVSAQNYDLPTKQIREQICSAPVPECFNEIG